MKVLMVCLGNICRSPVAEGLLRQRAEEQGIDIHVDSAGTSNYHIGEAPDSRSMAHAKSKGTDISSLRGRQFCVEDFDAFDRIFVMDYSNYENVAKIARSKEDMKKRGCLSPDCGEALMLTFHGGEYVTEGNYQVTRLPERHAGMLI